MAEVCMVLRYTFDDGYGHRGASKCETITAECAADVAAAAERLLASCPDNRAYVTHLLESGRAFPGYRKMQYEFYGPGLVA
jgi:hypothetical protein